MIDRDNELEIDEGTGNVFADMGRPDAEVLQLKAKLAVEIVKVLDQQELTVRRAGNITGIAAGDFSRIRQAKLDRFTVDRLMFILGKFNQRVDVRINVKPLQFTPA